MDHLCNVEGLRRRLYSCAFCTGLPLTSNKSLCVSIFELLLANLSLSLFCGETIPATFPYPFTFLFTGMSCRKQ